MENAVKSYDIYGIVNNVNGKMYIGQSCQGYLKRFIQHKCPTDGSPLLNQAMHKYGVEAFVCELLDVAKSREEANEKEKMWIFLLGTYKKERGYNLSMGGTIGDFNEETRKKMSVSKIGERNNFYNKHHTEESRNRMSESKKKMYVLEKHPQAKKIKCVETGEIYECVKLAGIDKKASSHHIGQVANGKYGRKTAGGYHWEWA